MSSPTQKEKTEYAELPIIQENSLLAVAPPVILSRQIVSLALVGNFDPIKALPCLIAQESQGNEKAYNPRDTDGKEKWGLLQYDTDTFALCVSRYGLPNEILNGEVQKQCFIRMVADGESGRWPPLKKCLNSN